MIALHPRILWFLSVCIVVLCGTGCARLRNLPEGENMLLKNEVVVHNKPNTYTISKSDLNALAKPEANRKILGLRFNHTVYLMVNKKKLARSEELNSIKCARKNERRARKNKQPKECKTWRMFWAYTVGEPTVVIDSNKAYRSAEQMGIYLQKRGYFRAKVEPTFVLKNGQKGNVIYNVTPNEPYIIRGLRYEVEDPTMAQAFPRIQRYLSVDTGMVFDITKLDADRDRITTFYNNNGYYEFNKEYISYDADTTIGGYNVNLIMRLQNHKQPAPGASNEIISIPHKKYYIGNIFIDTQFDPNDPDRVNPTPLRYDGLYIYNDSIGTINKTLLSCIQGYNLGDLYQKDRIDKTYKRYSDLGVFRSTTILLVPRQDSLSPHLNVLDTYIRAAPGKRQSFHVDPHLTNRAGNMGIYANPGYVNKNLFKGAEQLELRMIIGMEASQTLVQTTDATGGGQLKRSFGLNTFEVGPEITLRLPRLFPLGCDFTARSSDPKTVMTGVFNYQRRPDYERTLSQLRYSYSFIENPNTVTRFNIDVVEFSIINIKKSVAFQEFLDRINDSFLASSYQNHLILSFATPTFTLNTQKQWYQRSYRYLRASLGGAGNLLNGIMQAASAPRHPDGFYILSGIRFAQYHRMELDYRYYYNVNPKNAFVWRMYGGAGVPRKNLNTLPFEKSFFSGGSNGMRAWQARTLGPGSSRDSLAVQTFNNIGELKLEGNFEYRFKMTKMFNWALFMDAGNIWLLNPDPIRKGADFQWDRFVSEIAVSGGLGLRLDFDIFLVRIDLGVKFKDPAKVPGERWLWQPKDEYIGYLRGFDSDIRRVPIANNAVINLGIGFPF